MSIEIPRDAPAPRLCRLYKWSDFNGYGFNLHADKGKEGQYIGYIDPNSPAELAGLLKGDRIIQVNGANIGTENHQQVVNRIKSKPQETTLLVISPEGADYYKKRNIVIDCNLSNIQVGETPKLNPFSTMSTKNMYSDTSLETTYSLRLCTLSLWQDFQGYGFNLQSIDGKPGQYVGAVDRLSPAQLGGLKENDRLLRVNNIDVTRMGHKDVVNIIKSNKNSVSILVVDPNADRYFAEAGVKLPSDQARIIDCKGPQSNPYGTGPAHNGGSNDSTPELKNLKQDAKTQEADHHQQQQHQQQGENQHYQQEHLQQHQPQQHEDNQPHNVDHHQHQQQHVEQHDNQQHVEQHDNQQQHVEQHDNQHQHVEQHDNQQQHVEQHDTRQKQHDDYHDQQQQHHNHNDQYHVGDDNNYHPNEDVSDIYSYPDKSQNSNYSNNSVDNDVGSKLYDSQRSYDSVDRGSSSSPRPTSSSSMSNPTATSPPPQMTSSSSASSPSPNSLIFAGSAKEARERMSRKKNVKEVGMTLKDKYELLKKL